MNMNPAEGMGLDGKIQTFRTSKKYIKGRWTGVTLRSSETKYCGPKDPKNACQTSYVGLPEGDSILLPIKCDTNEHPQGLKLREGKVWLESQIKEPKGKLHKGEILIKKIRVGLWNNWNIENITTLVWYEYDIFHGKFKHIFDKKIFYFPLRLPPLFTFTKQRWAASRHFAFTKRVGFPKIQNREGLNVVYICCDTPQTSGLLPTVEVLQVTEFWSNSEYKFLYNSLYLTLQVSSSRK